MKIAVLIKQTNINSYENIQFRKQAIKSNIDFMLISIEEVSIVLDNDKIILYVKDKIINDIDVLIPRMGCSTTLKYAAVINSIKQMGVLVLNDGDQISLMLDKYQTLLKLKQAGMKVIKTMLISSKNDLDLVNKTFKYPLIKKSNSGSLGKGIYLIKNQQQLTDMQEISKLLDQKYYYILQEFIDYKIGEDLRVFMFDDQVVGAMKRHSLDGDFKSNYTIHKNATQVELSEDVITLCQNIMKCLGCNIAGIDLLETKDGFVVCEVNSSPGFLGLESVCTNLNVAKEIIKLSKKKFNVHNVS